MHRIVKLSLWQLLLLSILGFWAELGQTAGLFIGSPMPPQRYAEPDARGQAEWPMQLTAV